MNSSGFDDTSYEQLQLWIESGKVKDIPAQLVEYMQALELVRSMYDKYDSKKFIITTLTLKPWSLTEYQAKKLYTESLNFFYANNEIKREAWANIYADRMDKVALLAIALNDVNAAKDAYDKAFKYRMGEKSTQIIPRELLERRPIFYTLRAKDVGLPEANRSKLAQWIDSLDDIPDEDRLRLHRDGMTEKATGNFLGAEIEDIPFYDVK